MVKHSAEIIQKGECEGENNPEGLQAESHPVQQLLPKREMKKMVADRFHLDASKKSYKKKQKQLKEKSNGHLLQAICGVDTFLCSICCEVMVGPTIIECGHSFCVECAEKYADYNTTCPICRNVQQMNEYTVSGTTDGLIKQFASQCMSG